MTAPVPLVEIAQKLEQLAQCIDFNDLSTVLPMLEWFTAMQEHQHDNLELLGRLACKRLDGFFDGSVHAQADEKIALHNLIDQLAMEDFSEHFQWPPEIIDHPELELAADSALASVSDNPETSSLRNALALPDYIDNAVLGEFLERFAANAHDAEEHLLHLEKSWEDEHRISAKGIIHTIKGEAGVLGLFELERICHILEDVLEAERAPKDGVDRLLAGVDWMRQLSHAFQHDPDHLPCSRLKETSAYQSRHSRTDSTR